MKTIPWIPLFMLIVNQTEAFSIAAFRTKMMSPTLTARSSIQWNSRDTVVSTTTTTSAFKSQLYSTESGDDNDLDTKNNSVNPKSFREAEVLGLRLMQEGQIEEALKVFQNGLKLPGSRTDIIRTKNISGPSPVGGSTGGTEGRQVQTLDEFETQAAHYNIACAYARLDQTKEACASLEQAFNAGFDNYATVAADPDLASLKNTSEYKSLMSRYDKKGFNPFGLFQK